MNIINIWTLLDKRLTVNNDALEPVINRYWPKTVVSDRNVCTNCRIPNLNRLIYKYKLCGLQQQELEFTHNTLNKYWPKALVSSVNDKT